jgi:putative ABC transport system ATP-binding protein
MGSIMAGPLRGVDLNLYTGELAMLLGPPFGGKSILLNILGCLDTPTAGPMRDAGRDLSAAAERELTRYRRLHVGFVFRLYNLIPSLAARDNVAIVTEIARDPMTPQEARGLVGRGTRLDYLPAQLPR